MSTAEIAGSGPYKGLAPFGDSELDALLFFGREREREIVVANLIASRLTVLYGPSGVGKSSLLRAGVARELRALPERPLVVTFADWSEEPALALAEAVAEAAGVPAAATLVETVAVALDHHSDLYLILDQLEEYFLYHAGEDGPGTFADELPALLARPLRVNVLLSLREDALARLDRFKGRIPNLFGNYLRLDLLDRAAGGAAIVRPVERWNELEGEAVEIEPELVEAVLDDVGAGRIGLGIGGVGAAEGSGQVGIEAPYLQLVMQRLWDVEHGARSGCLRARTLEELGGAQQIVADHLERAIDALTPAERDVAARLFNYLVTPSGTKIAHDLADLAEYVGASEEVVRPVALALADRRILRPNDAGRYEIFHDVLAGAVLGWRARYEGEQAVERAHTAARRRHRRLAFLTIGALVAVAAMAAGTVFALTQRSDARRQAQLAHARELDATALSQLPVDPELGLLLARDSGELSPTPTAEDVLRQALVASRVRAVTEVGRPLLAAAALQAHIVIAAADGSVLVTGAGSSRSVKTGVRAVDASIAAGGDVLLTGSDGRLRLVSGEGTRLVPLIEGARGADISNDAKIALVRRSDSTVRLVDLASGATRLTVDHGAPATASALSAGGKLLATGGVDRIVRIWRAADGKLQRVLKGHVGPITAIAFSRRGTLVATASTDGIGRVWRVGSGEPVTVLSGHANLLTDIAFSPDGTQVVTASSDRTARTWKAETGAALATFAGDTEAVASARFTASGEEVVTASPDGTARTWDAVVQPMLHLVADLGAPVTGIQFVSAGRFVATAGGRRYSVTLPAGPAGPIGAAPAVAAFVRGPGGLRAVIDGKTVTVTHANGSTVRLAGHRDRVTSTAFSDDGKRVVTASADHDARIWDTASGALLHVLRGHFAIVSDARFSPDGRWVATAGPVTAGLWNALSGRLVYLLQGHEGKLLSVAFAPDGRSIATGGEDGTVRLYRCAICGGVDELLDLADARLARTGRVLTDAERDRLLG